MSFLACVTWAYQCLRVDEDDFLDEVEGDPSTALKDLSEHADEQLMGLAVLALLCFRLDHCGRDLRGLLDLAEGQVQLEGVLRLLREPPLPSDRSARRLRGSPAA
jgi:hypothetical protein